MSPEDRYADEYERAAGGLDYDENVKNPLGDHANELGSSLAAGPEALLEQVEEMIPDSWKEQISHFPISAIILGVGVGIFLGMKKGDQLIAAGSSMVAAAATANLNQVLAGRSSAGAGEES